MISDSPLGNQPSTQCQIYGTPPTRYTHTVWGCHVCSWIFPNQHIGHFAIITMTSWCAQRRLKSPVARLFTQSFIQAPIKENVKAPRHWPLCGEFTGHRKAENVSILWRHRVLSFWAIALTHVCNHHSQGPVTPLYYHLVLSVTVITAISEHAICQVNINYYLIKLQRDFS